MTPAHWKLAALGAGVGVGLVFILLLWRACRRSGVRWEGLIVDETTGLASSTKAWSHIGNAAMTVLVLRIGWNTLAGEGIASLLCVYGGLVAGSRIASQIIGARYSVPTAPGTTTTKETTKEVVKVVDTKPAATPESAANPSKGVTP